MSSRTRGYLPHREAADARYFLTFRLQNSLPATLLIAWKEEIERDKCKYNLPEVLLTKKYQQKIEKYLDQGLGDCWLSNAQIARVVECELLKLDGQPYLLHAWSIMPNHVHVVCSIYRASALASIVKQWKGATALQANRILGRTGTFWQREYFDRLIRNEEHFGRCVRYTLRNPVKAGLCDDLWQWPWNGCSHEIRENLLLESQHP